MLFRCASYLCIHSYNGSPRGYLLLMSSDQSQFSYTKEVVCGNEIVLEFATEMQGKYINLSKDIITFNDERQIVEFKVMIRHFRPSTCNF